MSALPAHAGAASESGETPVPVAMQQPRSFQRFWRVGVALACCAGAALVLGATSRGVGLSPDSVQYLAAAQSATDGKGLITYAWEGEPTPLTHFPPGYPLALTAAARVGLSSATFARWFNVVLFTLTIVLAVAITRRLVPESRWPALTVAALYAAAHDLVVAHSMAWTEPLYLTLTLVGCLTLAQAIDRRSRRLLIAAGVLAGLSAVVRYVGITNIGVIALAVLLWWPATWWRRLRLATVVALVAALPLLATLLFGADASGGTLGNRSLGWHPVDGTDLRLLASVIGKWVSPLSDATYLTAVWLIGLGILIAIVVVARARSNQAHVRRPPALRVLAHVMFMYAAAYVVVVALSTSLADAQTAFDARLLVPLLAITLVVGVVWLSRTTAHDRGVVRLARGAIIILVFAAGLSRVLPWARDARSRGLVLRRLDNGHRQLIAATKRLPSSARVYSNRPYYLRVQTSRMVPGLPRVRNPNSLLPNSRYADQVRAMCDGASMRDTYVVLFPPNESEDPTVDGDAATLHGDVSVLPGGRVIKLRPGCRA